MASRDIVRAIQDLTGLDWNERASSSGTAGTYLKARTGSGSRLIYYKLPRYNGVVIDGYECVNELLASRLMDALGIEHLAYRLIHAKVLIDGAGYETWLNSSRNFRKVGERKLSLGAFFDLYKNPGESPMELYRRFGWQEDIARMMLVDYLMANRDRHASNIEVLAAPDGSFRIAPIFDTGFSLLAPLAGDLERIAAFDPLADVATTNFVGSRSLEKNLRAVAPVEGVEDLDEARIAELFDGLEGILPSAALLKMREIIQRRWARYEEIRADR